MLDTTLSDENRYPLKLRDLIVLDVDREVAPDRLVWATGRDQIVQVENVGLTGDRFYAPLSISEDMRPYEGSVLFIDPSGRGKDETAYCVAKMLHGRIYIRQWSGMIGGYEPATLEALAKIAKEENVNEVWTESNFGDGMFNSLFAPVLNKIHPCKLDEYRVTGQKEQRVIDKLEPPMNSHRVVMDKSIVEGQFTDIPENAGERAKYYNGFWQLAFLTRDRGALKQDDRIDVLAEAVGYFTEQVARDTEKAADKSADRRLDAELNLFLKSVGKLQGTRSNKRFF
jgi:hypothetical protein